MTNGSIGTVGGLQATMFEPTSGILGRRRFQLARRLTLSVV